MRVESVSLFCGGFPVFDIVDARFDVRVFSCAAAAVRVLLVCGFSFLFSSEILDGFMNSRVRG